jgi:hypothetical protein
LEEILEKMDTGDEKIWIQVLKKKEKQEYTILTVIISLLLK